MATDTFAKIGDIKGESLDLKWQQEHILAKIGDAFGKMDDVVMKLAVDVLSGGLVKGELGEALVKIDFFSSKASDYLLKLDDPLLQGILSPTLDILSFSWGALAKTVAGEPPNNPDIIEITLEKTDDVISEA